MIKLYGFQNIQYINKMHCILNLTEFTLTYNQQNALKQTNQNHKKGPYKISRYFLKRSPIIPLYKTSLNEEYS